MKAFFISLFILFTVSTNAGAQQFSSASLTAAGLTCAMCTKAIYESLGKIKGVESVDADIKSSAFLIKFNNDAFVDPDALKRSVEDAGFSVAKLELNGQFNNLAIKNDAHITIAGKVYHFLRVPDRALSGKQPLRIVDRNFLSSKEFKRYHSSTNHPCVETGKADECCASAGATAGSRVYHVTL